MKYNKEDEFDVYELFNNEKYRARLVLGFYAVLIAILVITLRTGSSSNKNDKKDNSDKESIVAKKDNDDDETENEEDTGEETAEEDENDFDNKFVYLLQNNYEFDYKLIMDDKVINSKGKRTGNEMLFDVTSSEGVVNCYGKEESLVCNADGTYKETNFPGFFFNYFNSKEIIDILNESTYNEEDKKYHIDNVALYSFGDGSIDFSKVEKEKETDNTIELIEKNGKVVGIKMDFSNLFNNEDTGLEKVQLELNYSNFGFVDGIVPPENTK